MVRYKTTNLRFSEETYRELRYQAARRGKSLASLVRESVDRYLGRTDENDGIPFGDDPVDALVGSIAGGPGDESVNHDHYLYGWPKEEDDREAADRHERASGTVSPRGRKSSGGRGLRPEKSESAIRHDGARPRGAGDTPSGSRRRRSGHGRRP